MQPHRSLVHRLLIAFVAAVALPLSALGFLAVSAPTASAAVAQFSAPQCEGTTSNDPTQARGDVPDLTQVFGQRLVDYNAGRTVLLYGNEGANGNTPNCSLRVNAQGEQVSEWLYCTDHAAKTCSVTNAQGQLTIASQVMGSLEPQSTNPRLSADQTDLVGYILTHDITTTELPYNTAPGVTTGTNASSGTRMVRQFLAWCVTDRSDFNGVFNSEYGTWCDANMGTAEQDALLAAMPTSPTLTVSPATATVDAGSTTTITVATNLLNQPLQVTAPGATVALCPSSAGQLTGGELTLSGAKRADATATLCVTATQPGTVTVAVEGAPSGSAALNWEQSPGNATFHCQVYATVATAAAATVADSAVVTVTPVVTTTGGFSVVKKVTGTGADQVAAGTAFTLTWTLNGGTATTVSLKPGEAAHTVADLPAGSTVVLREAKPPVITGVVWGTPQFSVDGSAATPTATFRVQPRTTTQVVLTNTATRAAVASMSATATSEATTAPTSGSTSSGSGSATPVSASGENLASAGSSALDLMVPAALLIMVGAGLVIVVRRRSTTHL